MPAASGIGRHAHVQVGQIAVVDERPVVLARADHANEAVQRILQ